MIDPRLMDMIMRLRSRGIYDTHVLGAIEAVPRRYFVPGHLQEQAYLEQALPIDCGQTLSPPLVIAMMTQALDLEPDHKLLEIGTGSGYHAAILSKLTTRVYSVERYHQLIEAAETCLRDNNLMNVVIRHGDGLTGWKGQAPFDRIIVTCGLDREPKTLLKQLSDSGRLVAVVKGILVKYDQYDHLRKQEILPLELPLSEIGASKAL